MPRHSLYALLRFTICFLVTFAFSYDFPTFAVFHPTWFLMSFLYLLVVSSFSSCFLSILFSSCFLFSALFQEQISKDKLDFSYLSPDIHSWNAYHKAIYSSIFMLFFLLLTFSFFSKKKSKWWAQMDSNHRPHAYQACALTTWAIDPHMVEVRRFELLTPCVQGRCSPNWAIPPYLIVALTTHIILSRNFFVVNTFL